MHMTARSVRRGRYGMFVGGLLTVGIAAALPTAQSAPDACNSAEQPQLATADQHCG